MCLNGNRKQHKNVNMSKAKKIFCIIAYDIEDDRIRNKVAKLLEKQGTRINYSVFECMLTENELVKLQEAIAKKTDRHTDRVVYYRLCVDCFTKIVYQPLRKEASRVIRIV